MGFNVNEQCGNCGRGLPESETLWSRTHGFEFCDGACLAGYEATLKHEPWALCLECGVRLELSGTYEYVEGFCSESCHAVYSRNVRQAEEAAMDAKWERQFQEERDGGY